MKCVTPMFRLFYPSDPDVTGKVISRSKAWELLEKNPNYYRLWDKRHPDMFKYGWALQQIPCKKCWACQLNYSAEWATRIMLEAKGDPNCYFITLTYDDEHLPIAEKIEVPEGETYENDGTWTTGTLYEPDMVRFLNSLRKQFERQGYEGIKYFYAAEYGSKTARPHYHIILLHCPLRPENFRDCHVDANYKAHWKSEEIGKFWKEGMHDICQLEWSCAAYVARYCTKKLSYNVDKKDYYVIGKIPEFVRMSKGIGFTYLTGNLKKIYTTDEIIMRTVKGNIGSAKPPKAFDRKLEQINPDLFEKIKISRQHAAERAEKYQQAITDYTDKQNLIMSAEKVKKKMQMLPRVGEW